MLHKIIKAADRLLNFSEAKAHCDIPCGIYDPIFAQISALTTVRMIDTAFELEQKQKHDPAYLNAITRMVLVKEEHAERCKHETRVLLGDYFKPEHFERYPELKDLSVHILKLASDTKHNMNREMAMELLQKVNRLAEIFWETKGVRTKRAKAPYDPKEEVVYPVLA